MEHHAPHKSAVFEGQIPSFSRMERDAKWYTGYYSKFDLPSGAHIALVICTVQGAKIRPHMVSFTYVPAKEAGRTYQREIWADEIHMIKAQEDNSFNLDVPGIGFVKWNADGSAEYELDHEGFFFKATQTPGAPWSQYANTPENVLVKLPLPLHWHVQSLASNCSLQLEIPGYDLPRPDRSGSAIVHSEKNWASSFPSAHMYDRFTLLEMRLADDAKGGFRHETVIEAFVVLEERF